MDGDDLAARLRAAGCVYAEEEAALLRAEQRSEAALEELVRRREAGEPLEHVLGHVAFAGLDLRVSPGTFVPRQGTVVLAEMAVALLAERSAAHPDRHPVLVDLCCGVGAIAAVALDRVPLVVVHAADLDPAATACARDNLDAPSDRASVYTGDLFDPLPRSLRGRVDVLAVNAPYVPTPELALMPPEARLHEPRAALDGGADGLDVHRRVIADAGAWLAPDGHLVIEVGARQVESATALLGSADLAPHVHRDRRLEGAVVRGTAHGGPGLRYLTTGIP